MQANEKQARDGQRPKNMVAERVKAARKRFRPKLTQEDLSARVETYGVRLNRLLIGRIEAGTRIVLDYELRALAAALYVPVSWLVAEEELYGSEAGVPPRPKL